MKTQRALGAVDLYSGIGGWALGLRMAGIGVMGSYDLSGPANETNLRNNRHDVRSVDITRLDRSDLPSDVDIVVGSPPCTEFSFSNRGGNGNLAQGLEHVAAFLTVVEWLKPRAWAMENVPRMSNILDRELRRGGQLARFAKLGFSHRVFNMEKYGLPQRRRRCIAGNFDFDLLESYMTTTTARTLGDVVNAFREKHVVRDPLYDLSVHKNTLSDHEPNDYLSEEQKRINRANKVLHPVYNSMPFPDSLERSVRTITATCTPVARESVVIEDTSRAGICRRLTLRERATIQGFPITFQFYGASYSQKMEMIGNAMPPVFSYYIGLAMRGAKANEVPALAQAIRSFRGPAEQPARTPPYRQRARYPQRRSFRFAIPSLRLKSGVRFELANVFFEGGACWKVAFVFGTSKSIHSVELGFPLLVCLGKRVRAICGPAVHNELLELAGFIRKADVAGMQNVWSHSGPGATRPFAVLDRLDAAGHTLRTLLDGHEDAARRLVANVIEREHGHESSRLKGLAKLQRNATLVLSGLLVGSVANCELGLDRRRKLRAWPASGFDIVGA